MSDAKIRQLERRWRESGATEDEANYLKECVRVGILTQTALREAALLGHEAAEQAAGTTDRATRLTGFLASHPTPSRQAAQRAAIAAARVMVESDAWDGDEVFLEELDALEDWVACPCNAHREALMGFT
jgi:hypothetical protein